MKKTFYITTLVLLALALGGCKPELKGELGEPFDKIQGMSGTWELSSFIQKDLNNPIKEERDLSPFYINGIDAPMTLQMSASDRAFSVEIVNGKNFFGQEGTWMFDDDEFPTLIFFDNGVELLEFKLGRVVRPFDHTLSIELDRQCINSEGDELDTVVYIFNFNRVS